MTEISLQSATIIEFGSFHLTNAVLAGILETLILMVVVIFVVRNAKLIPGKMQMVFEMMIDTFLDFLIASYGTKKRAMKYLPFYITLFSFLLLANQFSVIPLVNQIVTGEGELLFRASTADFSQPITLAIFAVIGSHILALTIAPIKHIGNFIKITQFLKVRSFGDLGNAFLEFFLGILDIVGEFAKFISISARLFGNIFAGEVMVVVIAAIASWTAYILPIPFLVLSIFSGFVQAYVFAVLALQFTAGAVQAVEESDGGVSASSEAAVA